MVKNFLNNEGLAFKEVNVQRDQQAANKLVATTGQLGVPQIEVNGKWVLGYDPESIMRYVE
jgi:glutaredoxin